MTSSVHYRYSSVGAVRRRHTVARVWNQVRSLALVAAALAIAGEGAARAGDAAATRPPLPESAWGMVAADLATGQIGVVFASSDPLAASTRVAHEEGAGVAILLPPPVGRASRDLLRELTKGRPPERAARGSLPEATLGPTGTAAIVSARGEAWVSGATGGELIVRTGAGYVIVASRVAASSVVDQMEKVFAGARGPLPIRLMAALQAGEEAGGGALPARSALVWVSASTKAIDDLAFDGRGLDLRIDEHPFPVLSLRGLSRFWRLEGAIRQAVAQGEGGDWSAAARSLARMTAADPTSGSLFYLLATALVRSGDTPGALGALRRTFHLQPSLADFARTDPALAPLAPDPEFQALVGPVEAGK